MRIMQKVIKVMVIVLGLVVLLFVGLIVIILTTPSDQTQMAAENVNVDVGLDVDLDISVAIADASADTPAGNANNPPVSLTLDGRAIDWTGQAPISVGGNYLVPMRATFEALGFNVFWDEAAQTGIASGNGYTIVIPINSEVFYINGEGHSMALFTQIVDGSTMIPVTILNYIGYDISWDGSMNLLAITTWDVDVAVDVYVAAQPTATPSPVPSPTPTPDVAPPVGGGIEEELIGRWWGGVIRHVEFFQNGEGTWEPGVGGATATQRSMTWSISDNRLTIDDVQGNILVIDIEILGGRLINWTNVGGSFFTIGLTGTLNRE